MSEESKNAKNEVKVTSKVPREKSTLYPYYDLKESVEFAKLVQGIAGKGSASEDALAAELKVTVRTKSFTYKVSSARQFGLLSKTNEGLQLTDRAKRIINPVNEETDVPALLKEAFQLPPLYNKLIAKYNGVKLPALQSIANLLCNDHGITVVAKERAAKVFVNSAQYAKVVDSDGILIAKERDIYPDEEENKIQTPQKDFSSPTDIVDQPLTLEKQLEYQTVQLALSGGRNAKLVVPRDITSKEVDRMKKLIDLLVVEA